MLHSLKRATVGSYAIRNEPTNSEYDNLRRSLEDVSQNLQSGLSHVEQIQKKWESVMDESENFYTQMAASRPLSDESRVIIRTAADAIHTGVRSGTQSLSKSSGSGVQLVLGVRSYVTELKVIAEECIRVDTARKDYVMYVQKLEKLKSNTYTEPERFERNKEKMEKTKILYDALLRAAMDRMNIYLKKAPQMTRAVFMAHVSYNGGMCGLMANELDQVYQHCLDNEHAVIDSMKPLNAKKNVNDQQPDLIH